MYNLQTYYEAIKLASEQAKKQINKRTDETDERTYIHSIIIAEAKHFRSPTGVKLLATTRETLLPKSWKPQPIEVHAVGHGPGGRVQRSSALTRHLIQSGTFSYDVHDGMFLQ